MGEIRASRPISRTQAPNRLVSIAVGDHVRILAVVCFCLIFDSWEWGLFFHDITANGVSVNEPDSADIIEYMGQDDYSAPTPQLEIHY